MIDLHLDIDIKTLSEAEAKKKIDDINMVAEHFCSIKYFDESKYCTDNALEMAEEIQYIKGIADAKNNLGLISYEQGNYEDAIEKLTSSAKLFHSLREFKNEATAYSFLGISCRHIDDYETMIDILFKALSIFRKIADEKGEGGVLNSIGGYYLEVRQEALALEYYAMTLDKKRKQLDIDGCIRVLFNTALIYSNLDQHEKSLAYYFEALNLNRKLEQSIFLEMRIMQNIAHVYTSIGKYEEAEKIFIECIDYYTKNDNLSDKCDSLRLLGSIYVHMHKFDTAKEQFEKAESIAIKLNSKRLQMLISSEFLSYYKALNDFQNALVHAKRFGKLDLERNKTMEKENIRKLNVLHKVDITRKETEILSGKNENLKILYDELVKLNDGKNYFLNLAANDLKLPLQKINEKINYIRSRANSSPEKSLSEILEESSRMQKIISGLLTINELDTVKYPQ